MLLEIVLLLFAIALYAYWSVTKHFNHWKDLGVPYSEPSFPFGSWGRVLTGREHGWETLKREYSRFSDSPFYGIYFIQRPQLVIRDLGLIKTILVKDFDHFVDRSNPVNSKELKMTRVETAWRKQVATLNGKEWKSVRATFSPMFTSGKLKAMTSLIEKVAESLVDEVTSSARAGEMIELKDLLGKFSMDSIASCAFGVDAQSFSNKDSEFVRMASNIFKRSWKGRIKGIISILPFAKRIYGLLGITLTKKTEIEFFLGVIEETLRMRKKDGGRGERRNDMVDLMTDLMRSNDGEEENLENEHEGDQFEKDMRMDDGAGSSSTRVSERKEWIDDTNLVGTALSMLVAGYDTTAQTLAYCGYHLAKDAEVQRKLQIEIDEAFENSGGRMPDYSVIQGLPYLDMVLHETLRMHPLLDLLTRCCVKDYQMPGGSSQITVKSGESIYVNVVGVHYDPRYYDDPDTFNPENFSKEKKAARDPYAFLAFGQGPRACMGMRFALLESKIALAAILNRFSLVECEKTVDKIELDPATRLGGNKGGLWVRAQERKKKE